MSRYSLIFEPTVGHLLCSLSMLSALDNKSSVGRLFYSICPCFQHWTTGPLWVACSLIKSSVGRLFSYQVLCGSLVFSSVYAFGTRLQVLYGSLVLFSVYAFSTRQQVLCGSLALCYLSMLSALDYKSSIYGSLVLFSVYAFSTRPQVLCGSRVLCYLSMLSALDYKSSVGRLL
jgi:hypothetical protein